MVQPIRLVQFWDKPEPPEQVAELIARWAAEPGFAHVLYDRDRAEAEIAARLGPREVAAFRRCGVPAMQADFFRYCTLHASGGLYLDADTLPRESGLAAELAASGAGLLMHRGPRVANDVLYFAEPGHPLLREVIDRACANIESGASNNVWEVTGPGIMTRLRKDAARAALFDGLTIRPVAEIKRFIQFNWKLDYKRGTEDWREAAGSGKSIYAAGPQAAGATDAPAAAAVMERPRAAGAAVRGAGQGRRGRARGDAGAGAPGRAAGSGLEIQVFGLQRSGNHGIITWIAQQFPEPVVFLNNVEPFEDPFLRFRRAPVKNTRDLVRARRRIIDAARGTPREVLMVSYENLRLPRLADGPLIPDHDATVGPAGRVVRLLILRDFFNWLASRIKLNEVKGRPAAGRDGAGQSLIDIWLEYAREFEGQTAWLGTSGVVRMAYPSWSGDPDYRASKLAEMGIALRDNSNDRVPEIGKSSFDGTAFDAAAQDMQTSSRWSFLLEDRFAPVRQAIARNRDSIEPLNRRIFGAGWIDEAAR